MHGFCGLSSKKLLGTKGIATRFKELLVVPGHTSSSKKLLVARSYYAFKKVQKPGDVLFFACSIDQRVGYGKASAQNNRSSDGQNRVEKSGWEAGCQLCV